MYFELKENKPHGTKDDPFSTYHIKNEGRSFQIPVHWHDELEIICNKNVLIETPLRRLDNAKNPLFPSSIRSCLIVVSGGDV